MKSEKTHAARFTPYQKLVVGILAFLQFTIILDFMILWPLGAIIMPSLNISPAQFGLVVSVYAFSAGAAGLMAAGFADRFDRKKILLFFYAGFLVGTFLCGIATNYHFLLFARMVTGLFGGVIGSIVFAITTDLFPLEMRGRVMGSIQTAFASSQIMGIPFGIFLSNHWGWHAPFLLLVVIGIFAGILIVLKVQPIDEHLKLQTRRNAVTHLVETLTRPRYVRGFMTTALLATGGFMLMPFSSAFSVHNLGVSLEKLPMVYLVTGICSIVAGPIVGRAADRYGKFKTFLFGSILSIAMVQIYTRLGVTPLEWVIAISVFMFIGISSRMIAASALMSAIPAPQDRGAFMSVNSSIQQISGGLASVIAGLIVVQNADGTLGRFPILGDIVSVSTLITLTMIFFIDRMIRRTAAA